MTIAPYITAQKVQLLVQNATPKTRKATIALTSIAAREVLITDPAVSMMKIVLSVEECVSNLYHEYVPWMMIAMPFAMVDCTMDWAAWIHCTRPIAMPP